MAELLLARAAAMMGGTLVRGRADLAVRRYNIDSRLTEPGELFFAVVAGRDGHDFVPRAAEAGAAGAVVSREVPLPRPDFALIRVEDTVRALQGLAAAVLAERPVRVVAVTGSAGKTTTKELAAALLATRRRVLKSEGNLNNHLGLALSLLRLEPAHDTAVLEMAMNHPGEILALTRIAPPDVAVVINVLPVHLEFFGSVEEIARAKREILDGAKPDATAVLNGDEPLVRRMAEGRRGPVVTFGLHEGCRVRAVDVERRGAEGLAFTLLYGEERVALRTPLLYESFLTDILAACGAAFACGIPAGDLEGPVRSFRPFDKRGTLVRLGGDVVLVDESYNSNPRALEAALGGLAGLPARRRVAVLGDMLELGPHAAVFHEEAGRQAARAGWSPLVTVGPLARRMAEGARSEGLDAAEVASYETAEEAAEAVAGLVRPGDLVLVKGSRGVKLEAVVERLKAGFKEE
jgi:UDP-N-acetylmuramoyl-tripeptide--D-alanyl-D-alanine ligase